jgi:omega-6 fatty acid desaturase (delta-12 desaturase)
LEARKMRGVQSHGLSRKALLRSSEAAGVLRPCAVFALNIAAFAGGCVLALSGGSIALKLLGSVLITAGMVRLFLIGHDACHGSFFSAKISNSIVGRIAFMPSMTAFSLWDVGHNVAHHGFNNLKGRDQVWTPYSKEEFDRLPRSRRIMERVYRSGLGWGLYYLVELWWKKLYFATRKEIGSGRIKYKLDSALVSVGAVAWIAGVVLVAYRTHQSLWVLALFAIAIPFALWNTIMGFVVYVQHTHPKIAWYLTRQEWQRSRAYLTATANVRLPLGIDRLMHSIMEHHAHHMNPRISMFALRRAQRQVQDHARADVLSYRLNWRTYRDCVRYCKLYDYTNHAWLNWRGEVTARIAPLGIAPAV